MNTGDIIELFGTRRYVGLLHREVKTFTVYDQAGVATEVPLDIPHKVLANPAKDWPFVSIKEHRSWGAVTGVSMPGLLPMTRMVDWLSNGSGGIFLNPSLRLRLGESVNVQYASGRVVRVTIRTGFTTVSQRIKKLTEVKPKEHKTAFDHLMFDDEETEG